jgi:hypothetical protein
MPGKWRQHPLILNRNSMERNCVNLTPSVCILTVTNERGWCRYIYIYIYIYMCVCVCVCVHTQTHTDIDIYVCVCVYIHKHTLSLLHARSEWILYTPALWPVCVEPSACDVHLRCFNTPLAYLMLNTNNLLHANTTCTQCTTNTIFTCNTNNTSTRASANQVIGADWLMRTWD